jgi:hypothetical protein
MLPEPFAALEPFAATWSLPTEIARHERRRASSMDTLRDFYDAMLPRMLEILSYLKARPLDGLGTEDERLMQLTLSLAEVAPAVELFGSPIIKDAVDSRRFRPAEGRTAP